MKKNFLILVALCLGTVTIWAQPKVTISVQQNKDGTNIRVGGTYANADYVTIDCRNLDDNTVITSQAVKGLSGGSWYYDKTVVSGKKYRFAVKASNKAGVATWAQIEVTAVKPVTGSTPPAKPTLSTQTVMETRGIGVDEAPAVFFDNRILYAPKGLITNGGGVGMTATKNPSVSLTVSKSSDREATYGTNILRGTRVNVFPNANTSLSNRFNGEKVIVGGKSMPNMKYTKALSNKNEECILVGLVETGMWYYVPRRCLVP